MYPINDDVHGVMYPIMYICIYRRTLTCTLYMYSTTVRRALYSPKYFDLVVVHVLDYGREGAVLTLTL